jgi:predicted CopG family antitoxin
MTVKISIPDSTYKELTEVKKQFGISSYSNVIKLLLHIGYLLRDVTTVKKGTLKSPLMAKKMTETDIVAAYNTKYGSSYKNYSDGMENLI